MRFIKGAGAVLAVFMAMVLNSPAIEGLTISVQCPNVVLGWPSNPGETYIVQWRPTLDPSTPWVMLTNGFPADSTANWTCFVHSNQVQCATNASSKIVGDSGDGSPPTPNMAASTFTEPMAMPVDGSGSAAPLILYPPDFDFSQLIILDPSSGNWINGTNYSAFLPMLSAADFDGPQPLDDGTGGVAGPACYRLLRSGEKRCSFLGCD